MGLVHWSRRMVVAKMLILPSMVHNTLYDQMLFDRSLFPMTYVSWSGAEAYCNAINRRLPTEAEWERAARGADNSTYPWGFQWFDDNRANTSRSGNNGDGTWTVDTIPANSQTEDGLANMAGNVAEWTGDYYNAALYQQREGQAPPENPANTIPSNEVVVRGGAWDTVPLFARTVSPHESRPESILSECWFPLRIKLNRSKLRH